MQRTACWLAIPVPAIAALVATRFPGERLSGLARDPASARLVDALAVLAIALPAALALAAACFRQVRLVQAMSMLAALGLVLPALGAPLAAPPGHVLAATGIAASLALAALLPARCLGAHLGVRALLGLAPVAVLALVARVPDAAPRLVHAAGAQVTTPWGALPAALIGLLVLSVLGPLSLRGIDGALEGVSLCGALVCGELALVAALPLAADILLVSAACSGALALGALAWRRGHVDALTNLPARRALDEALDRLGRSHCVAVIDVDHFKRFNDRHGHDVGDEVLRLVARILARLPRGTAYRQGGEEFVVLLPRTSLAECAEAMEALRSDIEAAVLRSPGARGHIARAAALKVTVSVGLAARTARNPTARDTLRAADQALLRAKKAGRNRVEVERRRVPPPRRSAWRPHLVFRRVSAG